MWTGFEITSVGGKVSMAAYYLTQVSHTDFVNLIQKSHTLRFFLKKLCLPPHSTLPP